MGLISNNQSFYVGASGNLDSTALENQFQLSMDSVLVDLGRDVTIHLQPTKLPCPDNDCVFNSFYQKYVGQNGVPCDTCKGQGFLLEPRWTIYKANIRWTDEPYNSSRSIEEPANQPGRLGQDFCRTKMVVAAFDHIKESVGATIDGINVELHEEPRKTGFGNRLLYVVTWWKVSNR